MAEITGEVERVENPTAERFVTEFLRPQRPVVLTRAIDDWRALSRWEPEYLRSTVGTKRLRVEAVTDREKSGYFGRQSVPQHMDFGEYLSRVFADQGVPRLYMGGISLAGELPELAGDVSLPRFVQGSEKPFPYLWLGAGGSTTQLHFDINNNFHALIRGHKEFILFPPDQSRFLYPTSVFNSRRHFSQVRLEDPDYTRFPNLRKAKGCQVRLKRGDMLFLPSLWWHEVRTIEPSIAVNYWWGLNKYGNKLDFRYVRELPLIWWTVGRKQIRWRTRQLLGK